MPIARRPLSRERVLAAALEIADQGGLAALSMRKLAEALGVKAMSLYNHVANRDAIIDGLVEIVVSEIALPEIGGDWKAAMRQRALSAHRALLRHPWAALAILSRLNTGPAMLRSIDATLGCLVAAGFSLEQADHGWNAVDSHIYGFTLQEINFPIEAQDYAAMASSFLPQLPVDRFPHLNALSRQVIECRYDGLHAFSFGLEFILDGLERSLGPAAPPESSG
ncbi:TetR/AcrR family transcriptional regulator C-terminal domain-containing protein [Synechococcus sp. CS-602]|uniref:TetR/AcrR family transcriptional regulator C-terminal domain-containing protein n=1 Tax=Synechococcaceae TaxID=1890426 RepID=UPI0008FF084B|nr:MULTISPECIES: TetR/AcrR family transcriptional regulator C-terminal domain-containing protein [Synechococcaceae]MCT4365196.1 TetR/AcrR family transcriptional regulator C-terminal domain-containing protein [Candidatus Regnicoccus frigidus MAG-AL1]MCT0203087.1 TetR/AcrR family transcriptional regulator C-terminal domain-containing protein [Synechococcus sp. CS-603]MCT0204723.1 TetR/AcrR family transcriptional regulator C-terminal domain-containing protein [Synechococcus sp. CS-602]MCT0246145.1